MLQQRHVPGHFFPIREVTVGRFATALVFDLDRRQVAYDGDGNSVVGLDDRELRGRPLHQGAGRVRIRQRLERLPQDLVIGGRYIRSVPAAVGDGITAIPCRATGAVKALELGTVGLRLVPIGGNARGDSGYRFPFGRGGSTGSGRDTRGSHRGTVWHDLQAAAVDPSFLSVDGAHLVVAARRAEADQLHLLGRRQNGN